MIFFHDKSLKEGWEGTSVNIIKNYIKQTYGLYHPKLEAILLQSEMINGYSIYPLFFDIVPEAPAGEVREEKN